MIDTILSSILQILIFLLIPTLIYRIFFWRKLSFRAYIGWTKSNKRANIYALGIAVLFALPILMLSYFNVEFREILLDPKSVTGGIKLIKGDIQAAITILVVAIFKTALSEEILFRGFMAKRLIRWLGFVMGNGLHAIIFGLIHTLLFLQISTNIYFLTTIFIFPALGAYLSAYINEKMAGGSIIPGWIAHLGGNLLAYSFVRWLF